MQAAEEIGPHAHDQGARIVIAEPYAGMHHFIDEVAWQIGRAVGVHGDVHLDTTLGRRDQLFLQGFADLVVEEDEGLDDDLALGRADRLEDPWKEVLAVFQQGDAVSVPPFEIHRWKSAARGAWSDRCDHG